MSGEWDLVRLGVVIKKLTKGTTPTTLGSSFEESGVHFLKVESISADGRIVKSKLSHIDEVTHNALSRSQLEEHDLLFTIAGTIGRVAMVSEDILPANTNQAVAIVRPDCEQVIPRYLYFVLRDETQTRQADARVVQSVQANFSLSELADIEIPLPPLLEQRRIAKILGDLDDKIELNRKMNETLEQMARALFKSWFVDFDPVRAKMEGRTPTGMDAATAALFPDRLVDSELGMIPEGWEVKTVSDLASLITKGTTPTQSDLLEAPNSITKVNFIRVNSIDEEGTVNSNKLTHVPLSVHQGVLKRSILKPHDILYTIAGTIGRISVVENWLLPANTNQAVAIIRPVSTIPAGFIALAMREEAFRQELHNNIVQAVQANLSLNMLSKARIVVPPCSIIPNIFKPIDSALSHISCNRNQSRTLSTLRDTLLPKLVSGEVRVGG